MHFPKVYNAFPQGLREAVLKVFITKGGRKLFIWPSLDLGEMHCSGAKLFWHGCHEFQFFGPQPIDYKYVGQKMTALNNFQS